MGNRRRLFRIAWLGCVIGLVVNTAGGCASTEAEREDTARSGKERSRESGKVGAPMPSVVVRHMDGAKKIDLSGLKGRVVLVDIWVYTPFMMILLLAGLRALPRQPFEAAELDGVPASFVFFRITLPMLTPYIITASLFRMLDSIQQFDIIYAMTQGGPGDTLMVFQVQAYLEAFTFTNIGRSAAFLMVLWAITFVLSTLFIKQWLKLREQARGHG